MNVGNRAGQVTVLDLFPLLKAVVLEPGVQRIQVGEAWHQLPQPAPRILHVLLNLSVVLA